MAYNITRVSLNIGLNLSARVWSQGNLWGHDFNKEKGERKEENLVWESSILWFLEFVGCICRPAGS